VALQERNRSIRVPARVEDRSSFGVAANRVEQRTIRPVAPNHCGQCRARTFDAFEHCVILGDLDDQVRNALESLVHLPPPRTRIPGDDGVA
jgi:hypothetical protein